MNSATIRADAPLPGRRSGLSQSRRHWESVYKTQPADEVSWFQAEPALSLKLIDHAALAPDDPIIDVGGGASVLVDRLLDEGYTDLSVLDISPVSLSASRERLGSRAQAVEWIHCDVREFSGGRSFELWHDRALFHFMTEESDRRAYIENLQNSLAEGGQAIIAAFAIGGPLRCSGLDIFQYDARSLAAELGTYFVLEEQDGETHVTPSGVEQRFAYFRFRRI